MKVKQKCNGSYMTQKNKGNNEEKNWNGRVGKEQEIMKPKEGHEGQ